LKKLPGRERILKMEIGIIGAGETGQAFARQLQKAAIM
jgi:predicted dinucleotide-binding enzyme